MRSFLRKTMLWLVLLPNVAVFIGAASNQLVLFVNNDKFPVMVNQRRLRDSGGGMDADGMIDEIHCVMTHQTHLNLLADIFDIHSTIESIGDLLMEWGINYAVFFYFAWAILISRKVYEQ